MLLILLNVKLIYLFKCNCWPYITFNILFSRPLYREHAAKNGMSNFNLELFYGPSKFARNLQKWSLTDSLNHSLSSPDPNFPPTLKNQKFQKYLSMLQAQLFSFFYWDLDSWFRCKSYWCNTSHTTCSWLQNCVTFMNAKHLSTRAHYKNIVLWGLVFLQKKYISAVV